MGGSNALASANMILAGYDKVIPLDETCLLYTSFQALIAIELYTGKSTPVDYMKEKLGI